jgi:hypothetical protein
MSPIQRVTSSAKPVVYDSPYISPLVSYCSSPCDWSCRHSIIIVLISAQIAGEPRPPCPGPCTMCVSEVPYDASEMPICVFTWYFTLSSVARKSLQARGDMPSRCEQSDATNITILSKHDFASLSNDAMFVLESRAVEKSDGVLPFYRPMLLNA